MDASQGEWGSSAVTDLYGPRILTPKELLITRYVSEGLRNEEIAPLFGVTKHVIKNYMRAIYDKTGMSNRTELALWYVAKEG